MADKNKEMSSDFDIVIVGGLGHVGLPLGLAFVNKGLKLCFYEIDRKPRILKGG